MRIVLFIGSLDTGGAERQLVTLANGLCQRGHEIWVVTLYPGGQNLQNIVRHESINIISLTKKRSSSVIIRIIQLLFAPWRLKRNLSSVNPERVYSMLHICNLFAWIATRGAMQNKLIWGCRASNVRLNWKELLPEYLCRLFSSSVPMMIANSSAGAKYAIDVSGFLPQRIEVIPNGIDTNYFHSLPVERELLRKKLGVDKTVTLIGLIARIDPMKGHDIFLKVVAKMISERDDVYFIIVGDGIKELKRKLEVLAIELNINHKLSWLGNRDDMPSVYNALDFLVSSSTYGEGCSNAIAEAMACGKRCVVTNVGDSAEIVGDTGFVIPPNNTETLFCALKNIISAAEYKLGSPESRIKSQYSVERFIDRTESVLKELYAK